MYRWWINGLEWSPLRSDHFQRKNYLYFANRENLRIFRLAFSRDGRRGKRHPSIGFLRKNAFSPLTEAAVSGINKNDKGE